MNFSDRLAGSEGYTDTVPIRKQLAEAEAANRKIALKLAHERHAEYEGLAQKREAARKKLEASRRALEKMRASKADLESRVASLMLQGDEVGMQAVREDYRGIVEKYEPNGVKALERDEAAYVKTEYDPEQANQGLMDDLWLTAGEAGYTANRPTDSAPEGKEIYERFIFPAELRAKEYRNSKMQRQRDASFQKAVDEGRVIRDGSPIAS